MPFRLLAPLALFVPKYFFANRVHRTLSRPGYGTFLLPNTKTVRLEGKQNGTVLKSFTSNAGTDLCLVAQESVIKKLTRHKGQTVLDLQPSEIVEYSPEFGFGVKVVGIKVTVHCCNTTSHCCNCSLL